MFKEELIILRHARSLANVGQSTNLDDGLSDWGVRQSRNLARYLSEEMPWVKSHSIYVSPFKRCLDTAMPIHCQFFQDHHLKNPAWILSELREYLNHGKKAVHVKNRSEEYSDFMWDAFPEEGVTYDTEFNENFLSRMHGAFEKLNQKSIVITHGLPAFVLSRIAVDPGLNCAPVWDCSQDNASITWIKKGRVIWHGKNLFHEVDSWAKDFRPDVYGDMDQGLVP